MEALGVRVMKKDLQRSLQTGREVLLWKLDGLSEYEVRRPMTPTGTNLLGLVKHLAGVEIGYFGTTFGRPYPEDLPWLADDADPTGDLWATAQESRDDILGLYRRVWAHSDATIAALDLDAPGRVPHWDGARAEVTLHGILVHVVAETHRHAGHADVVREAVDGAVGHRAGTDNMASDDPTFFAEYRARLERVARATHSDRTEHRTDSRETPWA